MVHGDVEKDVSILVLMDLPFLHAWNISNTENYIVSILVLMDLPFLHAMDLTKT